MMFPWVRPDTRNWAYWGESGIPAEWEEGLGRTDMIEKLLQALLGGCGL
jgi:hypothetical protein